MHRRLASAHRWHIGYKRANEAVANIQQNVLVTRNHLSTWCDTTGMHSTGRLIYPASMTYTHLQPLLVHQHKPSGILNVFRALHTPVARQIHTTPSPCTSEVTIELDNERTDFSALLLRDLCQCPNCVHESTNQRLYSTADIPSSIQANSIETTPDSVKLTWSQDVPNFPPSHTTTVPLSTLRSIAATGSRPVPHQASLEPQVLWGAKDPQPPDTTFAAYLEDDVALYNVMRQLRQHGLVFITDIPRLEDALEKIAKRMGPMKDTFYGYTWDGKIFRTSNRDAIMGKACQCSH